MGYNIIRTELNDAALDCLNKTSVINDYLSKIEGGFQGLVDNKYFAGSGAETIKTYLECVQLTAIRVIQLAVVEYAQVFSSFAESFSIHDESYEAVFNEDYFDELLETLKSLRTSLYENQVPAYNAETAVDDIIKEDYIKNYDVYDDPLTKVITDISYLSRCIKRRDKNYKLNFQNVKDLIADAKCLVDKIKEKGVISFADMSNASYLNISEAQKMQEDFKKGCDYLWRNQAELKKGIDYISQYAEYKNDKLAQKRSEHGIVLIGEAILGITLVISTAGAGAPLVLTTIAGACDVGLACEGVQETYYGAIKDIETPSINPVRDYICMGNQEAYDMLSMLSHNLCFASGSINAIVSAGSEGTVGSTTVKEIVQIRTCAEEVTVNVAAPVGNYYIGKYATACTDNELLQFGIQVGGNILLGKAIKGVAHINGMGAQKLASKYYLEKPNIGINTSGLTTSKTNEVTGFAAGMSPEDAERYLKYCDECEKGIHNNHPGLDEQQYLDDFSYEKHFAGGDIDGIANDKIQGSKKAIKGDCWLLDNSGKFIDDTLENNYQTYIKRKISKGKIPKDRLEWKQVSEYWTKESPVARGNKFNKTVREADIYDYHEIYLENGKRLDSYDPYNGEIISRKATDLDKISEETYRKYLSEFSSKYSEGTKIRSNAYPELDGQELKGHYILEIPASNANIVNIAQFKKIAAEYGVILRFTEEQ